MIAAVSSTQPVTQPVTREETSTVSGPVSPGMGTGSMFPFSPPNTRPVPSRDAVPDAEGDAGADTCPDGRAMPGEVPAGASAQGTNGITEGVTPRVIPGYTGGRGGYGPDFAGPSESQVAHRPGFGSEAEAYEWLSVTWRTVTGARCRIPVGLSYGRRVLAIIGRDSSADPDRAMARAIVAGVPMVRSGIAVETVVRMLARCRAKAVPGTSARALARLRKVAREYLLPLWRESEWGMR